MIQWVEIKGTNVKGPVISKIKLTTGEIALGIDVNGLGGVYYVTPDQVTKIDIKQILT